MTTAPLSPSRHHCAVRRCSVAVTPSITLALAPSIASLPRCGHRRAAAKLPPTSRCRAAATAAATTLLPPLFALPPPPLTLPPLQHRRQAAAKVALSRCRHAAGTALPPRGRHRAAAVGLCTVAPKLPLTSRCRAAAAAAPPFVGWLLRRCPPSDFVRRSSEHHQQLTNGSTILFMFTFPINLDLFNLSTVSFGSILANIS